MDQISVKSVTEVVRLNMKSGKHYVPRMGPNTQNLFAFSCTQLSDGQSKGGRM